MPNTIALSPIFRHHHTFKRRRPNAVGARRISTPKQTDTPQRWKMALEVKGLSDPFKRESSFYVASPMQWNR
jgi:hypothetical protein